MWKLYNTEINKGESIRVFPISNWTEKDIWQYIKRENIDIVPLYFAAERPVVERDGNLIMVDDERMRLLPGEKPMMKKYVSVHSAVIRFPAGWSRMPIPWMPLFRKH